MPAEKFVTEFVKEAGFTPIPDRAIIVTYAPSNMSERIVRFFSNEFFALQMCQDSLVLLPFGRMSFMLKKDVALEIPYKTIHKVEIKEDLLNWRIELDTDEGLIALSAQQKELSEWRHSGTLSVGMSGLGGFRYCGFRPAESRQLAPGQPGRYVGSLEGAAQLNKKTC